MRVDSFIVWGHGVPHIRDIMCTLRANFDIITIRYFNIYDISAFIDKIYSCDTYPLAHLKAKNKYLMDVPSEIILVVVKNNNVQEREAGSGEFKGIQCDHVVSVKKQIREKYNPRPHNHVIHGTDYQSQTEHILKALGLQDIEYYTKNTPYHLDFAVRDLQTLDISNLRANILGEGLMRIEDTPHYTFLNGNRQRYEDYFFKHMGRGLNEDHFPEAFDLLNKVPSFKPIIVKDFRILDGVHRAAIQKFRGQKYISCWT